MITTEIEQLSIEIDGVEYMIAENTIETHEKLSAALGAVNGQPRYRKWLAELEVLLGKTACKELFKSGKKENIDRIRLIHHHVVMEFERKGLSIDAEQAEESFEKTAESVNGALKPVNDLLLNLNRFTATEDKKLIRRT